MLTRAAGCLASAFHAKATTGTIRAQLINIPARLARPGPDEAIHSGESVIAWVDRCGHAVAGMLQGLSRKASRSAVKTGTSCARAVAMSERMRQKALSPR